MKNELSEQEQTAKYRKENPIDADTVYHCYFIIKRGGGNDSYESVEGVPSKIRAILKAYFKCYPYDVNGSSKTSGFWGRLMKIEEFVKNSKDNTKVLCNIQYNTEILEV